ncbi:uncharacterized protein Dana_GF22421, isoform E [Drosophila ananassae]|uniref:Uncharacterized protein, isoform E n=1 Tax=Drosophila ananassae TaxID=7217 RepID=A0A0P8XKT8_DROAN|nr:uncharacterized protein LOC6505082 isoform X4 [Drosophila ananassae]KPU75393.1 uncharacterized protein Dana_GF22421, isoform E [Drosophila ananassae]
MVVGVSEKCSKMQQTHWNVSIPEDKNNNNNNNNDSEKNSGCHERIFLCIAKAVKQFIDLCNNLRAKYSAAATTAASPAASVSVSTSAVGAASSISTSFSATASSSSLTTAAGAGAAAQPQQKQHQQILVQFPTEGLEGGGAGAGASPAIRQISPTTAVKFLHARKFDVLRAVSLYEQHEQIRQKEHLYNIDPDVETLRSELQTGKFTILPARTSSGAAIALFTANRHSPLSASHTTTLQGIVYQLDSALQDTETQRAGLVFIYDMSGSKYSNFDYDLSQKILTLLKGAYPARLKKVLIVTAPLWFKAPFKILRLFVREKLRERVFTVSVPQLALHVPRKALPIHLGGTLEVDHATWLLSCRQSMTNREDELLANIVGVGSAVSGSAGGVVASTTTNGILEPEGTTIITESNNSSSSSNSTTNAVAATSNTTVVTIRNGVGPATGTQVGAAVSAAESTASGEPNENITINGLSPSHRTNSSGPTAAVNSLKLNTSGGDGNTTATGPTGGTGSVTGAGSLAVAGAGAGAGAATAGAGTGTTTTNGGGEFWSENPPSSASSGFSDDDSLAGQEGDPKPIEQIVQMVKQRGRHGLIKEYTDIRNRAPEGTFAHARMRTNLTKNRYTDVLCYDHSRVVLAYEDGIELSDYINANFVDGYKQKNAYISTQAYKGDLKASIENNT